MSVGLAAVSALLEARGGSWERWALTTEEQAAIGPPTAAMLEKYAGASPASVETTFLLAWAMYAVPRLATAPEPRPIEAPTAGAEADRAHLEKPAKLRDTGPPARRQPTEEELDAMGGPI